MENEILVDYFKKQCSIIEKSSSGVKQNKFKSIHKLRVATKKIRAFSVFLSELSSGSFRVSKRMKPLKHVFKASGRVRDVQVQKELLSEYEFVLDKHYPKFTKYLDKNEIRYTPRLRKYISQINFLTFSVIEHDIIKYLQTFKLTDSLKTSSDITNAKLAHLSELIRIGFDDESLHNFRKTFKELMFIYRINEDLFPKFESAIDLRDMEDFAEKLGKWHDRSIMLSYIEAYRLQYKKKSALKTLYEAVHFDYLQFMNNLDKEVVMSKIAQ